MTTLFSTKYIILFSNTVQPMADIYVFRSSFSLYVQCCHLVTLKMHINNLPAMQQLIFYYTAK